MKICMLVRNNCVYDNRVLKEADVLAKQGYDVNILALKDDTTPEFEVKNNIKFHRVSKQSVLLANVRQKYINKIDKTILKYNNYKEKLRSVLNYKAEKYNLFREEAREEYVKDISSKVDKLREKRENSSMNLREAIENIKGKYYLRREDLIKWLHNKSNNNLTKSNNTNDEIDNNDFKLIFKIIYIISKKINGLKYYSKVLFLKLKYKIGLKLNSLFIKPLIIRKQIKYKLSIRFAYLNFVLFKIGYKLRIRRKALIYITSRKIQKFHFELSKNTIIRLRPLYSIYDFHKNSYDKLVEIGADIYHSHDLNTLLTGYLVSKEKNAKLVYDSHELEIHRNKANESKFEKLVWRILERHIIKKCTKVITVSESIADYLAKHYKIAKPTVLLNAPSYYEPVDSDILRRKFEGKKIILYVGAITINRGLEQTVEAMQYVDDKAVFVGIGPKNNNVINKINELIEKFNLSERVIFLDPVPVNEIKKITSSADLGVIPIINKCLSYDLALPSKFFEYAFAELPMAVGTLKELSRRVEKHNIGISFNQLNPKDIAEKLNYMLNNLDKYKDKENFASIRSNMCWEQEQLKLVNLYSKIKLDLESKSKEAVKVVS